MRLLSIAAFVAFINILGCSKFNQSSARVSSTSADNLPCHISLREADGELQLSNFMRHSESISKAEVIVGSSQIPISLEIGSAIHQDILIEGSARTIVRVNGECTSLTIKRGSIVSVYQGYNAYEPSIIASVRDIQVNLNAGRLSKSDAANHLYDLYLRGATTGEQKSLEILVENGISMESLRVKFIENVSRDFSVSTFASSWPDLTHGLLIANAQEFRLKLPAPENCQINYGDSLSREDRLLNHSKCWNDREALQGKYLSGSSYVSIKSRVTITVRKSLDEKTIISGDVKAEPISPSAISESSIEMLNRTGRLGVNY